MSFQVLRGAIFAFVDELEDRILGVGMVISEGMVRLIEAALNASLNLVEAVIEEGFNLFRAGLVVIIGMPKKNTRLANMMGNFGFTSPDIGEVEAAVREFNYGDFDTDPWADGKTPAIEENTGDWPSPGSRHLLESLYTKPKKEGN